MLRKILIGLWLCIPITAQNKPLDIKDNPIQFQLLGYKPYNKVLNEKQLKCLTDNIYFEAANQKEDGKKAVALVTLNRLNNESFPDTICEIVYQRNRYKCQFSWVCSSNRKIKYWDAYNKSKKIAEFIMINYNHIRDITYGATFYHRNDIRPPWHNKKIRRTVIIGRHIFYKI